MFVKESPDRKKMNEIKALFKKFRIKNVSISSKRKYSISKMLYFGEYSSTFYNNMSLIVATTECIILTKHFDASPYQN